MTPHAFGWINWLVLLTYLFATVGLGLYFSRGNKELRHFMFGSGRIPWWAVGISLIATSLSASSFLGNPEYVFKANMALLMYQIGGFIAILFSIKIFIPFIRNQNVSSAYEILEIHFDGKTRTLAALIYVFNLMFRVGILMYGPALLFSEILNITVTQAILIIGVIAILYTYFGGMEAVIWTDVMQFFVLIGSSLFIFFYLGSQGDTLSSLWKLSAEAGHTQIFNFDFDLSQANNFWTLGLMVFVVELAVRTTDQQFVQRYLCVKSIKEAQKSAFLSWGLGFVFTLIFMLVGVFLYAFFQLHPIEGGESIAAKKAFSYFIVNYLPDGVTGILVAGIFAAAMSSLDSALTALSNTFSVDFLKKYSPDLLDKTHFQLVRWSILGFGVLGVGAGVYISQTEHDLLSTALMYTSLFLGPLLGLFILALLPKKLAGTGVFIGTIIGAFSLIPFKPALVTNVFPQLKFEPVYALSWPLFPIITCLSTVVFGYFLGRRLLEKSDV